MTYYERNLPHWQPEGKALFITWRLWGSLPALAWANTKARLDARSATGSQARGQECPRHHGLTKQYVSQPRCEAPPHVLFPQLVAIIQRYFRERVAVYPPADIKDLGLSPYYGWLVEILAENIRPDTTEGETPEIPLYESSRGPGSTAEVDFWSSRDPREVVHCHLNYVVPDTAKWEQASAYYIDRHAAVDSFVKNAGLGFAIPYLYNGQMHDYVPDFIIRLKTDPPVHVILETKGYDPLESVKRAAAERWVDAVNAEGSYGRWAYRIARKPTEVPEVIASLAQAPVGT